MKLWSQCFLAAVLLFSGPTACKQSSPTAAEGTSESADLAPGIQDGTSFLLAVKLASLTREQLEVKFLPLKLKPRYGVDIHRIFYKTNDIKGLPIKASGIVILPKLTLTVYPWISIQHVTITGETQAPSNKPEEGVYEASKRGSPPCKGGVGSGSNPAKPTSL